MYGIEVAQAGMRDEYTSIWASSSLDKPRAYTHYDFPSLSLHQMWMCTMKWA